MVCTTAVPITQAALRRARRQRAAERAAALLRGEAPLELQKAGHAASYASSRSSTAPSHRLDASGSCSERPSDAEEQCFESEGGDAQQSAAVHESSATSAALCQDGESSVQAARWSDLCEELDDDDEGADDDASLCADHLVDAEEQTPGSKPRRRRRRGGGKLAAAGLGDQINPSLAVEVGVSGLRGDTCPPPRRNGGAVTIADLGFFVGPTVGAATASVTLDTAGIFKVEGALPVAPASPCRAHTGGPSGVMSTLPCDDTCVPPVGEAAARSAQVISNTPWAPVLMRKSDYDALYRPRGYQEQPQTAQVVRPYALPAFHGNSDGSPHAMQSWLQASGEQLQALMPVTYED